MAIPKHARDVAQIRVFIGKGVLARVEVMPAFWTGEVKTELVQIGVVMLAALRADEFANAGCHFVPFNFSLNSA
jgi:hypothetical protein